MLTGFLKYILGLDKLVFGWAYKKCAELGAIFYLDPFSGFVMYLMFGVLGYVMYQKNRNESKKKGAMIK